MRNKLTRVLYELNALDKGQIRVKDMAQETGVSVRTIERDMNDIEDANFSLWNPDPGVWAFIEGFSLEKMQLTSIEASILVLMSDMASSLGGDFAGSFELLKRRLLALLEDNPFFIKVIGGEKYQETPITRTLEQSIRMREWVEIHYQGGKMPSYQLRPLKLIWMDGFWYLLSLTDDDQLLKFRLEKISSAKEMGKFFKYNKNIDKILKESTNIWFEKNRPMAVTLEVSAECAHFFKNKTYFPLQKVEKELQDGRIVLSCKAAKEEEILPTILHWLPHIKVVSPDTLYKHVKEVLNDYLRSVK